MKIFLIYENEIAGIANQETQLPSGYSAIEGPNDELENLYFDGFQIQLKPPKPSVAHYWDNELLKWVSPNQGAIPPSNSPNWEKLILLLENSPEWAKAYAASEKTLKANTAFTTLLTTFANLRKVENLIFAIAKLREAMAGISGIGDFTAEEINSINQKLAESGFDLQLT